MAWVKNSGSRAVSPVNVSGKGTGQAGGRTWASRLAFSHSSRRTWFMRSLFCLLEAWFWVRRSCIMTASASTAAGRSPCSPPGSVPAAASTEVRVGGGPRRRHGRVPAEQTGLRSRCRRKGSWVCWPEKRQTAHLRRRAGGEESRADRYLAAGPSAAVGGGISLRGSAQ